MGLTTRGELFCRLPVLVGRGNAIDKSLDVEAEAADNATDDCLAPDLALIGLAVGFLSSSRICFKWAMYYVGNE